MGIPEGDVPYKPNDGSEGTEHTLLVQDAKSYVPLLRVQSNKTPRMRKETMFGIGGGFA